MSDTWSQSPIPEGTTSSFVKRGKQMHKGWWTQSYTIVMVAYEPCQNMGYPWSAVLCKSSLMVWILDLLIAVGGNIQI